METLEFLGKAFALDNDGHLAKPEEWSRAIARELPQGKGYTNSLSGIGLSSISCEESMTGKKPRLRFIG